MNRGWLSIVLVVSACACATAGGTNSTSGGEGGADGSTTGGKGTSASTSTSGSGGAATGGYAYCNLACATRDDCVSNTSAGNDASHWACKDTWCEYLGCASDAECEAVFPGYICRVFKGASVPSCQPACSTAADCAQKNGNPVHAADHYTCDNGTCTWLGCFTDVECNWGSPASELWCLKGPTDSVASCGSKCASVADCITPTSGPAGDADNFECVNEICNYTGCNSDEECFGSYPTTPNIRCHQH